MRLLCLLLPAIFLPQFSTAYAQPVAEEAVIKKGIAYSSVKNDRLRQLDLYAPAKAQSLPVLVFVHGGAWSFGDKRGVQVKPAYFNSQGFLFVSLNYRLHPDVTYKEQAADVAEAVNWLRIHAKEYGGNGSNISLMGHSAGAHLVALVGTNEQYLQKAGTSLKAVSAIVLLDGAGYDIPRQIQDARLEIARKMYRNVFTTDAKTQVDASPITYVKAGKNIPRFLIIHVATRKESRVQSERFAAKLKAANVAALVVPAYRKTHSSLNRELGKAGDAPTQAVLEFLKPK